MNEAVQITYSESGSKTVIRSLDNMAAAADKAGLAVDDFKSKLNFGGNTRSTNGIKTALQALKSELLSLSASVTGVRQLKTELMGINSASTNLRLLATALSGINSSTTKLTGFTAALQAINQHANALNLAALAAERLGLSAPALALFKAEIQALVALTPGVIAMAAALRGVGGVRGAFTGFAQTIAAVQRQIMDAAKAAQQLNQNVQNLGNSANRSTPSVLDLKYSLAGVAAYLVAHHVYEWLNAWQSAAGLIKIATTNLTEMHDVQDQLMKLAQDTRQEFTPMVELYGRLARASGDLGLSQQEVINFTRGVATSLAIQHTSAAQARGALVQLGQAMLLGRLRAQEYNSINENLPVVLKTVAQNIPGVNGQLSKLRQMMLDGKLTAKEFFEAFMKGAPNLEADFKKSVVTLGQAFTVLGTSMTAYIGKLDDAIGFSDKFGRIAVSLGENLNTLIPVITTVGIVLLGALGPTVMAKIGAGLRGFGALLLANQGTAMIAALAGIALWLTSVSKELKVGESAWIDYNGQCVDVTATLSDLANVFERHLSKKIVEATDIANKAFDRMLAKIIDIRNQAKGMGNDYRDALALPDLGTGWEGALKRFLFTLDLAYSGVAGFATQIVALLDTTWEYLGDSFASFINTVFQKPLEWVGDKIIGLANKLREAAGKTPLQFHAELPDLYVSPKFGQTLKERLTGVMDAAMTDMDQNGFLAHFKNYEKEALKDAEARKLKELSERDAINQKGAASPPIDPKAAKEHMNELKQLAREYEEIVRKVSPDIGAEHESQKDLEILQKVKAHAAELKLDVHEIDLIASMIPRRFNDAISPLEKMIAETKRLQESYGMNPEDRKLEEEFQKKMVELKKQSAKYDKDSQDALILGLREQLRIQDQIKRVAAVKDSMYNATRGKDKGHMNELTAIHELATDPAYGMNATDIRRATMQKNPEMFAGTQDAIDENIRKYRDMYDVLEQLENDHIISEQTSAKVRLNIQRMEGKEKLSAYSQIADNLTALTASKNKDLARIGKAAAIANAAIKGWEAVQNALATDLPWPLPQAMAASAAVAAGVNVANIMNTPVGFMTGGEFEVKGRGGPDSQTVAFRATPGERVTVQTPEQYRKGQRTESEQPVAPVQTHKIVNILDPRIVGDYLTTSEGEKVIVNVMRKNRAELNG